MKRMVVSLRYATPKGRMGYKNDIICANNGQEAIEKAKTPLRKRGCSKFDGYAFELNRNWFGSLV